MIFGGTGFVGRHLCARLVQAGGRVTVPSRGLDAARRGRLPPEVRLVEVW